MMMKRTIWCVWAIMALLLSGCADHTSDFDINDYIKPDEKPTQPAGPPAIRLTGEDTIQVGPEAKELSIGYTIENPIEGALLRSRSDAEWISTPTITESEILFSVEANTSNKARTGSFLLSYKDAEKVIVTVIQSSENGGEEVVEPSFSSLSSSAITTTEALISCHFAYSGSETISEAGFCYCAAGGDEQESPTSLSVGTKQAQLTGLKPETTYSWYFYAAIGGELYTSATQHFTTKKESSTEGRIWRTTWPELPVEDTFNSDYYFAHHITDVTMKGEKARNYTVCFSAEHHCPVWVAAPRHKAYEVKTVERTDAYKRDPQIPSNIQYSSKDTGGDCNKGHMLGSAERLVSRKTNEQVFYYTNIAPQYSSGYNTGGGGWNILEDWIDGKVCSDTTYLVIGTYFDRYTDGYGVTASPKKISFGGRNNDVSCPTMFYIAVLRTKRGNTGKSVIECSESELMCAAFVRTHSNEHKDQEVTQREMMSISDLERLTGHQFFVNVPNAPKGYFKASDWGL